MDLPQHVAEAAIEAFYNHPKTGFSEYYEINTSFHPYYAYRKLQVWVTKLTNAEISTKILLSITIAAFPLSCLMLLAALRRNRWLVILCFPPAWNYMLFMGYTAYCLSVPLLIISMAFLLWPPGGRMPQTVRAISVFVFAALSWLMHAETFVFLFTCSLCILPMVFSYRRAVLRALPVALVLILFMIFSSSLMQDAGDTAHVEYTQLWQKIKSILSIMDVYRAHSDEVVFYIWFAAVVALIIIHPPRLRDTEGRITHETLRDIVPAAMLVILFTCFWLLPFSLLGTRHVVHVAERLLVFYPPFLVMCAGKNRPKWKPAAVILLIGFGLTIFQGFDAQRQFNRFDQESRGFSQVIRKIPLKKKVMSIIVTQRSSVINLIPYMHFGAYLQARRGGLHSFCFAMVNEIGIKYKALNPAATLPENWEWKPGRYFRYEIHGYDWDYFLVYHRNSKNPAKSLVKKGYLKLVVHRGSWFLYKNVGRRKLPKERPEPNPLFYREPSQGGPPAPGS